MDMNQSNQEPWKSLRFVLTHPFLIGLGGSSVLCCSSECRLPPVGTSSSKSASEDSNELHSYALPPQPEGEQETCQVSCLSRLFESNFIFMVVLYGSIKCFNAHPRRLGTLFLQRALGQALPLPSIKLPWSIQVELYLRD